jgi:hypothetical protein
MAKFFVGSQWHSRIVGRTACGTEVQDLLPVIPGAKGASCLSACRAYACDCEVRVWLEGTIDEKIFQRQLMKTDMTAVISKKIAGCGFTREELKELFSLKQHTACETAELMSSSGQEWQVGGTPTSVFGTCRSDRPALHLFCDKELALPQAWHSDNGGICRVDSMNLTIYTN